MTPRSAGRGIAELSPPAEIDPKTEALVNDLIGRVADKWTMLILEALTERGRAALHPALARGVRHQPEDAYPDAAPGGA